MVVLLLVTSIDFIMIESDCISSTTGSWMPENGLVLTTDKDDYPQWLVDVCLGTRGLVEYKYIICAANGTVRWESTPHNRVFCHDEDGPMEADDGLFGAIPRVLQRKRSSSSKVTQFCDTFLLRDSDISVCRVMLISSRQSLLQSL